MLISWPRPGYVRKRFSANDYKTNVETKPDRGHSFLIWYGFVIRREQVKTSIYIRSGDADATRDAAMTVPHMMEEINTACERRGREEVTPKAQGSEGRYIHTNYIKQLHFFR